ncbi:MAG: HPr kinase/phosphatase C-terminal domain-containing protein [Alphaproteobacteria bacterium]|nr:HPr kinase/phosphatase C-terminal domain-containing protein [Alphaproteobacteria bacterium]
MTTLGIYATSLIVNQKGVLITGQSGFGKSSLALELIDQGASLIADDVTFLSEKDGKLYASCDEKWHGCFEVRGLGIVKGIPAEPIAKIDYQIELIDEKVERMPCEIAEKTYCNVNIPVFKINKDEKYLPTLVKIAGKIVSKEVCLLSLESK